MIHYGPLLQNATDIITKCDSYFITNCHKRLLQNVLGFLLQNATVLLENATFITNCDSTAAMKKKKMMLLLPAKFARFPGEKCRRDVEIGFNVRYAMNISAQSATTNKIFL